MTYYNRHAHDALRLLGQVLDELEALRAYAEDAEALAKFRDELSGKFLDADLL